jgi:hypothetical protein
MTWKLASARIRTYSPSGGGLEHAVRPGLLPEDIKSMLALRRTPTPGRLINWFVNHQTAGSRMDGTQAGRPQAGDAPAHPLQVLYKERAKLGHLTRVVKRLFDFDLLLDTVGVNLLFRMGTPDVPPCVVSDFDPKYDQAVAALPQVQAQGDGIKSALGLLVPLISDFYPLVLLDEPEAHLHPPQARIIGVEIGNQARDNGSQVIVSTHDKNIVQGIVESEAPVTILHSGVRVTPQVPRCSTVRRSPSCGRTQSFATAMHSTAYSTQPSSLPRASVTPTSTTPQ